MSTTTVNPYNLYAVMKQAGWIRNFDISGGGHLCVPVADAPSLGSSPGGLLFFGHFTKPDGTTLLQRSNMDRSVTTIVIHPLGVVLHTIYSDTLIDALDEIRKLNII